MTPSEALIAKNLHFNAIKTLAEQFGGRIVDVGENDCIVQLTAKSVRVNAFLNLMRTFGVLEAARSGTSSLYPERTYTREHVLTVQVLWSFLEVLFLTTSKMRKLQRGPKSISVFSLLDRVPATGIQTRSRSRTRIVRIRNAIACPMEIDLNDPKKDIIKCICMMFPFPFPHPCPCPCPCPVQNLKQNI